MNVQIAREYAQVVNEIRSLKDKTDELAKRKSALEEAIIEEWREEGVGQTRVDGMTLYLAEKHFAQMPEGKEKAVEVLKAGAYADIVQETVNSNTLSAIVREKVRDGGPLPPEWEGIIEAGSRWEVGVRRAS